MLHDRLPETRHGVFHCLRDSPLRRGADDHQRQPSRRKYCLFPIDVPSGLLPVPAGRWGLHLHMDPAALCTVRPVALRNPLRLRRIDYHSDHANEETPTPEKIRKEN